jgi:hypothetical protein
MEEGQDVAGAQPLRLRAPDLGKRRAQHRVFHNGAGVANGVLLFYRDEHQHHPHGGSLYGVEPREGEGRRRRAHADHPDSHLRWALPLQIRQGREGASAWAVAGEGHRRAVSRCCRGGRAPPSR